MRTLMSRSKFWRKLSARVSAASLCLSILPLSLFVVERERDEQNRITAFVFTGRGWGHGVGLCQTGAYALAQTGYSSLRILQKYYTTVRVQKIY